MATASSAEDRLICPVCLGPFDRPRSLPCLHTFCTQCLLGHIDSNAQRNVFLTFPCPVCRADTKPPKPYTTRDKWTEQFPVNYWIVSAMEDMESRDRERVMHCAYHPDLEINLHCIDHDTLCCPMCVATGHRTCQDVVDIQNMMNSKDFEQEKTILVNMIMQLQTNIKEVAVKTANAKQRLESKKTIVEKEVGDNVETAIDCLKTCKHTLLSEFGVYYTDIEGRINENESFCTKALSIYEETGEILNEIHDKEPSKAIFIKLLKAKERVSESIQTDTSGIETFDVDNLHVKLRDEFKMIQDFEAIGKITFESEAEPGVTESSAADTSATSQPHDTQENDVDDGSETGVCVQELNNRVQLTVDNNFHFVNMINTATAPSGLSWITSAVSMKHKTFIVCDNKSSSIKLIRDGSLNFEYNDVFKPWGIAKVSTSQVAVSYPTERTIQIYDVKCDMTAVKLKILRKLAFLFQPIRPNHRLSTNDPCFGICFAESLLVVACEDCIQTYSMTGRMLQNIDKYDFSDGHFRRVIDVAHCRINNTIYACDEARNCVVALHVDMVKIDIPARFVYTHTNLRCPQGIATGPEGEVYVSGFVSRNIHVISHNGETMRILDVGQQPWTVCVDTRKITLFVSYYPDQSNSGACSLFDIRKR